MKSNEDLLRLIKNLGHDSSDEFPIELSQAFREKLGSIRIIRETDRKSNVNGHKIFDF